MADSNTLIFIPDISGFSEFVNSTEIKHSRHIISELLEIIVNSDELGMTVSEVEGDAVLFYKDEVPEVLKLIEQCKITFTNFHDHLKLYDTERICRCGACETASKLTLKFIIHAGEVEKIQIRDHQKLHGPCLIVAHRLLKNSIIENEYVLLTDSLGFDDDLIGQGTDSKISLNRGSDSYDGQPDIDYSYFSLEYHKSQMEQVSGISLPGLSNEKITIENSINAPVDLVYENFTNFEKRLQWFEELKDTILRGNSLNKKGSLHTCLVGNYTLDIESLGRIENDDRIKYGERLNKFRGLRDVISIYTFSKHGNTTKIRVDIDFKIKSFVGRIFKPMVKNMLHKQTTEALNKLKLVCEAECEE